MKIIIEGHVNDPGGNSEITRPGFNQQLSEARANNIYKYLISNGINENRMSKIGYGNKYMLFPNPKNAQEMEKNWRVEINVISIY